KSSSEYGASSGFSRRSRFHCRRRRWLPARFSSRLACLWSRLVGSMAVFPEPPGTGRATARGVAVEPGGKIQSVTRWVGFEFQRVVPLGVRDHFAIGRSQLVKVREGPVIIDDAVLSGEHQQRRLADPGGGATDQPVDDETRRQQSGGPLPEA